MEKWNSCPYSVTVTLKTIDLFFEYGFFKKKFHAVSAIDRMN